MTIATTLTQRVLQRQTLDVDALIIFR